MDNCSYNKTKLLFKLAKLTHFINTFAMEDADQCDQHCVKLINNLKQDLDNQVEILKKEICRD